MSEYIERGALLEDIENNLVFSGRRGYLNPKQIGAQMVVQRIRVAPVVQLPEGKRLTTAQPKGNLETALNLFYIKDHETWVRGGGPGPEYADVSLFSFARTLVKTYIPDAEVPADDDAFSMMMAEWLMFDADSMEGVIALIYAAAWTYAELRQRLMKYEDAVMEVQGGNVVTTAGK